MKKLLYISFLILFLVSCKQPQSNDFSQENIIVDTFVQKTDTITKISEPFIVNNIECYWKVSIIRDDEGEHITRELIEDKTQKIILKDVDFYHIEEHINIDFEKEKENFKDVNFDGFKDFIVFNYSNSPQDYLDFYNIHIFNKNTKSFDFSEELSDTQIKIDSINKRVTSDYGYKNYSVHKIHYFNRNGTIKFTEEFSEFLGINDTVSMIYKNYKKIINGEEVETKRDSIIEKWD